MNLITNLRHYVRSYPYRETQEYKVGEKYFKNGEECEITKIEGEHMIIKFKYAQFCVTKNYVFDKNK